MQQDTVRTFFFSAQKSKSFHFPINKDWRMSANSENMKKSYYPRLKSLIEEMHQKNGNQRVVVACHSYGNSIFNYFLNNFVSSQWKQIYIDSFLSISAPWEGAPQAIRDLLSGNSIINGWFNDIFQVFNPERVKLLANQFGAISYLFPTFTAWSQFPVVEFKGKNYTGSDIVQLLVDTNNSQSVPVYKSTRQPALSFFPNVNLHCFGGVGLPTEKSEKFIELILPFLSTTHLFYFFSKDMSTRVTILLQNFQEHIVEVVTQLSMCNFLFSFFFDQAGKTFSPSPHSSKKRESLRTCKSWMTNSTNSKYDITYKEYPNVTHLGILSQTIFLKDFSNLLTQLNN